MRITCLFALSASLNCSAFLSVGLQQSREGNNKVEIIRKEGEVRLKLSGDALLSLVLSAGPGGVLKLPQSTSTHSWP